MSENLVNIAMEWKDGYEIPHFQAVRRPIIMELIKKYPKCFEYRICSDSWIYHKNGDVE